MDLDGTALTRRTLLRTTAGGAAALTAAGLPAWARPVSALASGVRRPDSRPFPHRPLGHVSMHEIDHVVVLMMENHSFDNLLGMVPFRVRGRHQLDGFTVRRGRVRNVNRDATGHPVPATAAGSPCQWPEVPSQSWTASHISWDHGRNDGFVRASGPIAMAYWDEHDLPFTYSLARHFPIGERYFSSVLAQTYPNRRFLFAGTASGSIDDKAYALTAPAVNGTIFDRLDAAKVSWRVYAEGVASFLILPNVRANASQKAKARPITDFYRDAAAGRLPAVAFLDPDYGTTSEENPQDIQVGEEFVAKVVHAVTGSPAWRHTALFITYDEHGGYYDHVPPPRAHKPDAIPPQLAPGDPPGDYGRLGFRVPLFVVSPWARAGYLSRITQDHTSILAFIERKWNLPALTFRDANAHPMTDYFDFRRPAFARPPRLHPAPGLAGGLRACHRVGLSPPLPVTG